MNKKINIVIPMAGLGTRFKLDGFNTPKPLIEINNKTLIEHSVESLNIDGNYIFITRRYDEEGYNKTLSDKLKKIKPDSIEIIIDNPTRGAVETCLMAKELINNDNPLIITNCDQRLDWDSSLFLNFISDTNCDGSVVIFDSIDPKNSFAKVDEKNTILQIVEKNPISRNALMGIHFWKSGKDFVSSASELLNTFQNTGRPECYVSETYNFLIQKDKKIISYAINNNEFNSLGTPNDLKIFQAKIKEFYTDKPSTIFCDIDGTILKHAHGFSNVVFIEPEILKGVVEKFNQWDSQGHKIVLCTARKESAREITEKHLKSFGLCWDHLIMGLSSGNRYLINDKLNIKDQDRAVSINLTTNFGFSDINWNKYKL